jgi:hypothetical protein
MSQRPRTEVERALEKFHERAQGDFGSAQWWQTGMAAALREVLGRHPTGPLTLMASVVNAGDSPMTISLRIADGEPSEFQIGPGEPFSLALPPTVGYDLKIGKH